MRMLERFENLFDLQLAKQTNLLISGANHSGKTLLASGIASVLNRLGYKVIVLDVSGKWKQVSDLPYYSLIQKKRSELLYAELNGSGIYDLSLLKLSDAKTIVETVANRLWLNSITHSNPEHTWLFYEEAEGTLRNIRGDASESVFRLIHIGRNVNIRGVLITTDLALLDASVIRLCGIRFHGFLNVEENSKRKFRHYYGKEWTQVANDSLKVGDFIRLHKRKLDIVTVPEFKTSHVPEQWPTAQYVHRKNQKGFFSRLFG